MSSKPLRLAWPDTSAKILDTADELERQSRHWSEHIGNEKPEYQPIVTPQSKLNRSRLLRKSEQLMTSYLREHPEAAAGSIDVIPYDSWDDFLEKRTTVPGTGALAACSRGGYLTYAQVPEGDCITVAASIKDRIGKPALGTLGPCWGQEEGAYVQVPGLFVTLHGEGFSTRQNTSGQGNLLAITPVLVCNVVPLAKLGNGAVSTQRPKDKGDGKPLDYSTNVFHASPEQFELDKALVPMEGKPVMALFFSFADMRERYESKRDLDYTEHDLRDMATSAGKAIELWARNAPDDRTFHSVGIGAGIYKHAECVSAAVMLMMLALQGRKGTIYVSPNAFRAAKDMVSKVFAAMACKTRPSGGFVMDDFVQELWNQIEEHKKNVPEERSRERQHWRVGGLRETRVRKAPARAKVDQGSWNPPPMETSRSLKPRLAPPLPDFV